MVQPTLNPSGCPGVVPITLTPRAASTLEHTTVAHADHRRLAPPPCNPSHIMHYAFWQREPILKRPKSFLSCIRGICQTSPGPRPVP